MKLILIFDFLYSLIPILWLLWGLVDTITLSTAFYKANFENVGSEYTAPMMFYLLTGFFVFFFAVLGAWSFFKENLISLFKVYYWWKIFEMFIQVTLHVLIAKAVAEDMGVDWSSP
jgi:hypothetical protein